MNKRIRSVVAIVVIISLSALLLQWDLDDIVTAQVSSQEARFQLLVRSSPNAAWESTIEFEDVNWRKAWEHRSEARVTETSDMLLDRGLLYSDVDLLVEQDGETTNMALIPPATLVERGTGKLWSIDESSFRQLLSRVGQLREQHYGTLLNWTEAKNVVQRQSSFQVTDLESGLSFHVQRRAGSDHADVQPLTKVDTAIMKQIYGGEWSWKRRAIVITTERNERLAASMNGMPHGGDGIPDNGFKGHFCIHFAGSTTHKSDSTDLAHQLMTYKAAGMLYQFLGSASPYERAASFLEGVNQQDAAILNIASLGLRSEAREAISQKLADITTLKMDKKPTVIASEGELETDISINALVARKGRKSTREVFTFKFVRSSHESMWLLKKIGCG